MEYILGRLIMYHVYYEKVTENTLRVYGGFDGFSVIRYNDRQIEVDGAIMTKDEFETWLVCNML